MAIYSSNRYSSISEDSIDWTPDFSAGHVLEAVIAVHEFDQKMFDSLLECDFVDTYAVHEADGDSDDKQYEYTVGGTSKISRIWEKIKSAISWVVDKIRKTAANLIYKIQQLTGKDKKLVQKYKKVIKAENMTGYEGLDGFSLPNFKEVDATKGVINAYKSALTKDIVKDNTATREKCDAYFDQETNKYEKVKVDWNRDNAKKRFFEEGKEGVKVGAGKPDIFIKACDFLSLSGSSNPITSLKKTSADVISYLKDLRKKINEFENDAKKKANDLSDKSARREQRELIEYQHSIQARVFSMNIKAVSLIASTAQYMITRQVAAARKMVISAGTYCLNKENERKGNKTPTATGESAIIYALGEASDEYVLSYLGY